MSGTDLLSASKVLEYVIDDLKEAERRLANDPVIEQGPLLEEGSTEEENFWHYRTFRLNYYAVKALQARVYLYAEMFSKPWRQLVKLWQCRNNISPLPQNRK